jgi:hypothetical protein
MLSDHGRYEVVSGFYCNFNAVDACRSCNTERSRARTWRRKYQYVRSRDDAFHCVDGCRGLLFEQLAALG